MVRHVRDPVTGRCIICDKNKIVHYMDSDDPHSEGATATWDDVRKKVTYINALTNPTRPASHHPVNPTPSDPETRSPTDSKTGNPSLQSASLHSSPIPPSNTAAPDHSPSPDRNKSPIRVPETGPKYIESKPRGVIEVKQYQPPPSPPLPPRNIRQVYPNSPPPVYIVEQRPPVIAPRRQDSPIQVSESQPRQNGYSRIIDRYGTNHRGTRPYGDYDSVKTYYRGQTSIDRRKCFVALLGVLVCLLLIALAVGLYFAITSGISNAKKNLPENKVPAGYSGYYVDGVYVVPVTSKPSNIYLIYGTDTPCNPNNDNAFYPNCNQVTTKLGLANWTTTTTATPIVVSSASKLASLASSLLISLLIITMETTLAQIFV